MIENFRKATKKQVGAEQDQIDQIRSIMVKKMIKILINFVKSRKKNSVPTLAGFLTLFPDLFAFLTKFF